jgi:hypothetical protein
VVSWLAMVRGDDEEVVVVGGMLVALGVIGVLERLDTWVLRVGTAWRVGLVDRPLRMSKAKAQSLSAGCSACVEALMDPNGWCFRVQFICYFRIVGSRCKRNNCLVYLQSLYTINGSL